MHIDIVLSVWEALFICSCVARESKRFKSINKHMSLHFVSHALQILHLTPLSAFVWVNRYYTYIIAGWVWLRNRDNCCSSLFIPATNKRWKIRMRHNNCAQCTRPWFNPNDLEKLGVGWLWRKGDSYFWRKRSNWWERGDKTCPYFGSVYEEQDCYNLASK